MATTNASKLAAAKNAVTEDVVEIAGDLKDLVDDGIGFYEDSLEMVKKSWLTRSPKTVVMVSAMSAFVVGAGATYLLAAKRLEKKYQAIADTQVQDVKNHFSTLRKDNVDLADLAKDLPVDPEVAVAESIIRDSGYIRYTQVEQQAIVDVNDQVTATPDVEVAREQNVFASDNPDTYFDVDEESQRRIDFPDKPYVLTQTEFEENDVEHDQQSMTYFDGDGVLVDEAQAPIQETERLVGDANLLRFGHGSGDPNVVYIRNPILEIDFEIAHSDGKYTVEVLNLQDELTHIDSRRPRRFSNRDE